MTSYECLENGVATQDNSSENVVNGVAIGVNDTTKGMSGKKTKWPAETLREAADKLEGIPIVKDHPGAKKTDNGLQIDPQPPIDAKVGEVHQAKFKDGVGLLWQGEVHDADIREKIEQGIAEVSPVFGRNVEPVEGEEGLYKATEITAFRDLGIVSRGAAPSNSIDTGAAAMSAEALSEAFGEALKEVAGVEFTGTSDGKLDESEIEEDFDAHALYGEGENKEDYSYWVVSAEGDLKKGNVESAWSLGCRGQCPSDNTHDENLMALAEEFDTPPEFATENGESMGHDANNPVHWEACSTSVPLTTQSDDGAQEDKPQSSADSGNQETMSDDNTDITDDERDVLSAAESLEEPTKVLEEAAAAEQAHIVEQSEYESLQENVNEVRSVLEEALSEKTELKESTIEALGFDALCDEFRNEEGELQVEALRQEPETGDPEEPEGGAEALSDDADTDKAEALYNDMQEFGVDHEETIVEALGVEDFDTAKEVLD